MATFEELYEALGLGLSEAEKKRAAWANATPTADPSVRIDCDGLRIKWEEYGKYSPFGWHIDHVNPLALGGLDSSSNLRARHWRGNCRAGGILGSSL
jgi:hypothetical protein